MIVSRIGRIGLTATFVLMATTFAQADLKLVNIEASYGRLGPVRKSLSIYPYDRLTFRYDVQGIETDEQGQTDFNVQVGLTDSDGNKLLNSKETIQTVLALGGNTAAGFGHVLLNEQAPPGEYVLTITVHDRLSEEKASFRRTVTLKPIEFAIVSPTFFHDAQGKIPAPVGGMLHQDLHINFLVIGFDKSQSKIDVEMNVQVLDEQGRPTMPQPLHVPFRQQNPELVKQRPFVGFSAMLGLNRPGRFTLQITAKDRIGGHEDVFEAPLTVTAP